LTIIRYSYSKKLDFCTNKKSLTAEKYLSENIFRQ